MTAGLAKRAVVAAIMLAGVALGQTAVQKAAAKLDEYASQEEPRLGLESRIRGAERLCVADPPVARMLLDHALPALERIKSSVHGSFTYRFTECYARIDLQAAERVTSNVPDRAGVYVSLIRVAAGQKDFALVARLVRDARNAGLYSLAGTSGYLTMLPPAAANEALREMVHAFPQAAGVTEIDGLLYALGSRRDFDPEIVRDAIHRIFEAIDRPDFPRSKQEYEMISTFNFGGQEIRTSGTFETMLLHCAAYLAVYDFAGFEARRAAMPEWWPLVALASRNDLPGLMYVSPRAPPPAASSAPKKENPFVSPALPFDAAMEAADRLAMPERNSALLTIERRRNLSPEQRERVLTEMLSRVSEMPLAGQFSHARAIFLDVSVDRVESLYAAMAAKYLEILDAVSRLDDPVSAGLFTAHDELGSAYMQIDRFAAERRVHLPRNPTIEARRQQAELDIAAASAVDFTLNATDGISYQLSKLRGKVVLLNFWASGDPSMRAGAPVLDRLAGDLEPKGLVVLGVSMGSARSIDDARSSAGMSYPTLLDPDRRVHLLFGIDRNSGAGVPKSFVFDRQGNCVGTIAEPATDKSARAVLERAGL